MTEPHNELHRFVDKPDDPQRGHYGNTGETCAICGRDPRNLVHQLVRCGACGMPAHKPPCVGEAP